MNMIMVRFNYIVPVRVPCGSSLSFQCYSMFICDVYSNSGIFVSFNLMLFHWIKYCVLRKMVITCEVVLKMLCFRKYLFCQCSSNTHWLLILCCILKVVCLEYIYIYIYILAIDKLLGGYIEFFVLF